jgi:hypothetical protein
MSRGVEFVSYVLEFVWYMLEFPCGLLRAVPGSRRQPATDTRRPLGPQSGTAWRLPKSAHYRYARNGDVSALRAAPALTTTGSPGYLRSELRAFCGGRRMTTVRRRNSPANRPSFTSGVATGRARSSGSPRELRLSGELGAPEKSPLCRAFRRAADGIRTHDLLHGKQNLEASVPYPKSLETGGF